VRIHPSRVFAWQPNLPTVALPDGKIELEVLPPSARIAFGDDEMVAVDGRLTLSLEGGQKKDLFISANNFQPMRHTVGPLKPGSSEDLKIQLVMERWSLKVLPDPPDARVSFRVLGKKKVNAKGAQNLRGLSPDAEVFVEISRRRCRGQKHRVKSLGTGEQQLEVKLRCR
jgi:hypothetical protein